MIIPVHCHDVNSGSKLVLPFVLAFTYKFINIIVISYLSYMYVTGRPKSRKQSIGPSVNIFVFDRCITCNNTPE